MAVHFFRVRDLHSGDWETRRPHLRGRKGFAFSPFILN